ncbi:hypothetical protein IEQ34_002941 [Dendrobium chrysotoxum]|uniref:Chalcone--flavanone isomerase n=1 Tax=Dendrobium chrysotoxum TaxID=161865 RepID=A0AAV7HIM0_DENCH|nr:hypothetical protein IEQ34_002941 [Dendrobium chrysotoxum]
MAGVVGELKEIKEGQSNVEVRPITEVAIVKEEEKQEHPKENKSIKTEQNEEKKEIEPKTRIAFPVKLADGKKLMSIGLRRKKVFAININIYAFGIYGDDVKLKEVVKAKFESPKEPTREMFDTVIDVDAGMMVRLVIVFGGLSMSMVRKSFDEGIGASLKKLNGGKTDKELVSKVMGSATDDIKLPSGSVIEISRLPGFVLQTKVKGEVISVVQSKLLCRAYFHLYLGDDPFDKEAKEKFGSSLLSLF